jgi:membrane fusion protein (multidrug efflux system)
MTEARMEHAVPKGNGRRWAILAGLTLFFIVCGVGYGVYWATQGRYRQTTDDAYVQGNLVPVMSQVDGTVVGIYADDTELVDRGQPVVRLGRTDAQVALDEAEANLAATVRRVQQLYQTEAGLEAKVRMQRAQLSQSRDDYQHYSDLTAHGYFPRESTQHTGTQVDVDRANLAYTERELAATRSLVANTALTSHPDVKLAAAKVRAAYLEVQRSMIVAPVRGYVAKRGVQIGQHITTDTPLLSIIPLDQVWVEANFKESQLEDVRIGQPVTMYSDFYGKDAVFHGKVIGLGAGTGGAFALLPPQNATGNWIKVVQRVPLRIALDPGEINAHPLRVGLSMEATINTHDRSGPMLARQPHTRMDFTTDVYDDQAKGADELIAKIIQDNTVGGAGRATAARAEAGAGSP